MSTVSTTIAATRDRDLSHNPMVTVDTKQRGQSLTSLRNTTMFLKKLTFARKRAVPTMNDDMNASVFTRTDHALQLDEKTFNVSQSTLDMHISASATSGSEDRFDMTNTESSSPASSSQVHQTLATHTPQPPAHYSNGTVNSSLASKASKRSSAPSGLPSIPEPPARILDGLPLTTEPQYVSEPTIPAADIVSHTRSPSHSKPSLTQSQSTQSVPTTVSESGDTIFQDASCCANGDCEHCQSPSANISDVGGASNGKSVNRPDPPESPSESPIQPSTSDSSQIRQTQSLPSRRIQAPFLTTVAAAAAATTTATTSTAPSVSFVESITASPLTAGERTPRALHPRLASLPPPMMARYTTQGSARLTPSIVTRPPPMPILNLPTLPPPTPSQPPSSAERACPTRLRSMPALPHRGPSDMDAIMADHDNAGLDEMAMDDLDEEDEDGENLDEPSEDESSPTLEVPMMTPRLRGPLPPSISRSRGKPDGLPTIAASSPFTVDFDEPASTLRKPRLGVSTDGASSPLAANRGTVYFTPVEVTAPALVGAQTPKVPTVERTPATPMDYFNLKTQEWHSHPPPGTPGGGGGGSGAQKDPSRTPRPVDFNDFLAPRTVPMPCSSPRPTLTHHASKSMSDLLNMNGWKEKERDKAKEPSEATVRGGHAPDYSLATSRDIPPGDDTGPVSSMAGGGGTVRRQRSLPTFTSATEPPPYPTFSPFKRAGPPIVPREEEGRERLPPYTNAVYLAAIMPRKMEFDAPGAQSRDRKWKRALCVLEGTAFRVYKVHAGVVGEWWERTVGVGDKTSVDPGSVGVAGAIRVSAIRETERRLGIARADAGELGERTPKIDPAAPREVSSSGSNGNGNASGSQLGMSSMPSSRSRLALAASLLHPKRHRDGSRDALGSTPSSRSRLSVDMIRDEAGRSGASTPSGRRSIDSARPSSRVTASSASSDLSSSRSHRRSSSTTPTTVSSDSGRESSPSTAHFSQLSQHSMSVDQEPDAKDLLRQYTMQNAESGLASDYTKRKNVIRVRMEGEQFLLQARDVPAVIDWIEGIQAATNIALDLDERPMPKGPMFPRRRRRRPRRPEGQNATAAAAPSTSTSTTAQSS